MRFFVSYKSEDSNLVRGVAERLLARGLDLWFAEYEILPENYMEFQEAIDEGLAKATHGLAFTNRRWSEAEWCRHEMRAMLEKFGSSKRIIEICIPKEDEPHVEYPSLAAGKPIVFLGDPKRPAQRELKELVDAICGRLGISPVADVSPVLSGNRVSFSTYGVDFDPGPLRQSAKRTLEAQMANPAGSYRSVTYLGKVAGIDVSLDFYVWPFGTPIRGLSIDQDAACDDREVAAAYRKYALEWLEKESMRRPSPFHCRGLHLVFVGQHSEFGLTYVSKELSSREAIWERRYAISLRDQGPGLQGEVGFIFAAVLKGTSREQFEQACLLGPQFDAIACSLKQRRQSLRESVLHSLPLFAVRALYALAAGAGLVYLTGRATSLVGIAALAVMVGYFVADLMMLALRPLYKRLLWTMTPLADDASLASTYERLSSDLLDGSLLALTTLLADLVFLPRDLLRKPSRLLALAALAAAGYVVWALVLGRPSFAIDLLALPAGLLFGAGVKLLSVQDWISRRRGS